MEELHRFKYNLYDPIYRNFNSNVNTDDILLLLDKWDADDCMDTPSTFHMRESYSIKSQSQDPDTPAYMEALSVENAEECFKAMNDENQSLMRRDTWEFFLGILLLVTM